MLITSLNAMPEKVAMSQRICETSHTVYDGSIKLIVHEDQNFGRANVIKDFCQNFCNRISHDIQELI